MKWISNGDPPQYVWKGDIWYNQKDKSYYYANLDRNSWDYREQGLNVIDVDMFISFPKKTKVMK